MNYVYLTAASQPLRPQHRVQLTVAAALALCVFVLLDGLVLAHLKLPFDDPLLLDLHGHASAALDRVMLAFTFLGSVKVLAVVDVLVLAALLRRGAHSRALFWALAVSGSAALNLVVKHLTARTRPDLWLSIAPETSFSFPSGHAMGSMTLIAALAVLAWPTRWRWLALTLGVAFVLLVGLSRVYLGVHFPSDVLGGWTAALAWVLGLRVALDRHLWR